MHDPVGLLVFQHEPHSRPGTTLDWCRERGIACEVFQASAGRFPEPRSDQRVVILGGAMNVDQEEAHPWLIEEKRYLRGLLNGPVPVLGICLGAQLMSEVLGARVSKHAYVEEGWDRMKVAGDSGLPSAGGEIPAFQWHGYSFDIAKGAKRVFSGQRWENQGFLYGPHAGVQFHPEADEEFVRHCFEDTDLKFDAESVRKLNESRNWYFRFLDSLFLKS